MCDQKITAWKRYIMWEKENHLNLEDAALLSSRVIHAYKLAMANLRYFPEIWYASFGTAYLALELKE